MDSFIDHLVVAALTRESGIDYVEEILGVPMQLGGRHVQMGTHNALLKLDDRIYLEVIAIDPSAANTNRARWFELNQLDQYAEPRLVAWVVRTNDICSAANEFSLGQVEEMSRDSLSWFITIPPDGRLPMNGAEPMLIEWRGNQHPCDKLNETGCELLALEIHHPESSAVKLLLDQIGFASPLVHFDAAKNSTATLRATIKTPGGVREL